MGNHSTTPGTVFHDVTAMLDHFATTQGERVAIRLDEQSVSYDELAARSGRVAAALVASGIGRQDRVAVLARNRVEIVDLIFGIVHLNAVAISANWRLREEEIMGIFADAGARVVVVGAEFDGVQREALARGMTVVVLGGDAEVPDAVGYEDWLNSGHEPVIHQPAASDDVVLQLYTSGTTGKPKGVLSANGGLMSYLALLSSVVGFDSRSVSLCTLPLFHIGGVGWLLAGIHGGAENVLLPDADVARTLSAINDYGVTEMFAVPTVIQRMVQSPIIDTLRTDSLRTLYYGTGPITETILREAIRIFGCDFVQGFGMTEIGLITVLPPEAHSGDPRLLKSSGKLLPETDLRLVDPETGADVGPGEVGEIWVRSPRLMHGYWRDGQVDPNTFEPGGWFRTGDAARVDNEGFYFLQDRIKDMIVTGGENVYSSEVENVLMSHPLVAECAVIGVPHEQWIETVKALVVPKPGAVIDPSEVIQFCRARLAHFKCPTSVDIVTSLPRNVSGKVLKHELRTHYRTHQTVV